MLLATASKAGLTLVDKAAHDHMVATLEQIEREMQAGFGSSFGETREQVRRALKAARAA